MSDAALPDVITLSVEALGDAYPIYIGSGLLHGADQLIPLDLAGRQIFVIGDANSSNRFIKDLKKALKSTDAKFHSLSLAPGEATKSFESYQKVIDWIMDYAPTRDSVLVALGGGVIGDLTGFVAATLLRGVPFIQIPTTLLSQVDSSVGGKTAINVQAGKNLVGSFYQPVSVIIDTDTLSTLPPREYAAGMAEVIKYAFIGDANFLTWLEANKVAISNKEAVPVSQMIAHCCAMKSNVVSYDAKETSGVRALLNFGHTFGHALEKLAGYDGTLLHGEAVALGMVMAAHLSIVHGGYKPEDVARLENILQSYDLPIRLRDKGLGYTSDAILHAMIGDKKADRHGLKFILLKNIGEAQIVRDIPQGDVKAAIEAVLS
ncbi:MAG: 3-dehydroquinate synthase [Pseudobdellovibrionaceae bacterium]